MQDRELDALVAQHVFDQSVTWLRQPGGKREPWVADTLVYGDAPTVGPGRPWMRRVSDDDMEVWIDPNTALLVPRYGADDAAALQVVEAMHRHGFWCQMRTPFGTDEQKLNDGYWAGFTPHGVSGWNGTPDHWTSATTLPRAICLAALAALGVEVPS